MSKYYKVKKFICPECGVDFKKERQLKQHMKDAHNVTHLGGGNERNGKR